MTLKQYIRNLIILLLVAFVVILSFEYYFKVWVPRYYLALSALPSLVCLVQLTGMRAKSFEDRNVWDVIFIRNYPFMAAAISIGTLIIPQWMQNIMDRFGFNSWSTIFMVLVVTWIAQRVAHDKLFAQEERNALQRITGQVKHMRKGQDALLQKIVNGVIMLNHQGKLVLINKAAQSVLGYGSDEALGKTFDQVLNPQWDNRVKMEDEGDPLVAFKKKIIESKEPFFIHHLDIVTKKEEAITLNLSVTPIFEKGTSDASRYILIFEDITQKYQLDKMRQDFVNIASHELRTPLTAINGYLSLLMTGQVSDPDEAKLYLDRIFESTKRLSKLVKNILNVSRIDRKKMHVNFGPVDVQKVAAEEIQNLTKTASEKNIKLSLVNMLLRQTFARADEDMFREVVINFIENAIKYSNPSTEIKVALTRTDNNLIRVEVIDQGMGIEEKNISKLFKQFYRVENSMVEEQQGTGLGLYITKKYVEAMEGEIGVTSKFGEGSNFYFDLKEEIVAAGSTEEVRTETPVVDIAQMVVNSTDQNGQEHISEAEVPSQEQSEQPPVTLPAANTAAAPSREPASESPAQEALGELIQFSGTELDKFLQDAISNQEGQPRYQIESKEAAPAVSSTNNVTAAQVPGDAASTQAQTQGPFMSPTEQYPVNQAVRAEDKDFPSPVDSPAASQVQSTADSRQTADSLNQSAVASSDQTNNAEPKVAQSVQVPYTEPGPVQESLEQPPTSVLEQTSNGVSPSEASEGWKDWQQSGIQQINSEPPAQPQVGMESNPSLNRTD